MTKHRFHYLMMYCERCGISMQEAVGQRVACPENVSNVVVISNIVAGRVMNERLFFVGSIPSKV